MSMSMKQARARTAARDAELAVSEARWEAEQARREKDIEAHASAVNVLEQEQARLWDSIVAEVNDAKKASIPGNAWAQACVREAGDLMEELMTDILNRVGGRKTWTTYRKAHAYAVVAGALAKVIHEIHQWMWAAYEDASDEHPEWYKDAGGAGVTAWLEWLRDLRNDTHSTVTYYNFGTTAKIDWSLPAT